MNKYEFEVNERHMPGPLNGTTFANNEYEAQKELKEWYAQDLGTNEDDININIKEVRR